MYRVQCDVLMYVYIIEWLNQTNLHIHNLTYLCCLHVLWIFKIHSHSNFEIYITLTIVTMRAIDLKNLFLLFNQNFVNI